MTDLTKITTPFGLLDKETQEALKAHGGPWQLFGYPGLWLDVEPEWSMAATYRVKPQPLTKPSINWSHVAPQYKWLARDEDGDGWLYKNMPVIFGKSWAANEFLDAPVFTSYTPGTCDWRDSLVERPD